MDKDELMQGILGRRIKDTRQKSEDTPGNTRGAAIYVRVSGLEQAKQHYYSVDRQKGLVQLAVADGYLSALSEAERAAIGENEAYPGWHVDGQVIIETRDLGVSGTKSSKDRLGLRNLERLIESQQVGVVYVIEPSRLFRDRTMIKPALFADLCARNDVRLRTPNRFYDFNDDKDRNDFLEEMKYAAKELQRITERMHGARAHKALQGRWTGGKLPAGYLLDERQRVNGLANPDYHKYVPYEPHAELIRLIFAQLQLPGTTAGQVVRYLQDKGLSFEPYPVEIDQRYRALCFSPQTRQPNGSWLLTENMVQSIATNPVYIGWYIWGGEVISKNNHVPIIDGETFWAVQRNLNGRRRTPRSGPSPVRQSRSRSTVHHSKNRRSQSTDHAAEVGAAKRDEHAGYNSALPLSNLVYCNCQSSATKMYVSRAHGYSSYMCRDPLRLSWTHSVSAEHLQDALADFVLSQCNYSELAATVLQEIDRDTVRLQDLQNTAARQLNSLRDEVENLRRRYALPLSADSIRWVTEEIAEREKQIQRLSDSERPSHQTPIEVTADDILYVAQILADLRQVWAGQPDQIKNAFLGIVLARVDLFGLDRFDAPPQAIVQWQSGAKHTIELLLPRRGTTNQPPWTSEEDDLIRQHFAEGHAVLAPLLPKRSWRSILRRAGSLNIPTMNSNKGMPWSEVEDLAIRRWMTGKLTTYEVLEITERTVAGINGRAVALGYQLSSRPAGWRYFFGDSDATNQGDNDGFGSHRSGS